MAEEMKDEMLNDVTGGTFHGKYTETDYDRLWDKYKFDRQMKLEDKKIEAEIKKAWIDGGCKLGAEAIKGLSSAAAAAIKAAV